MMYKGLTSNQKFLLGILGFTLAGLSAIIARLNSIDMNSVSPQQKPQETQEIIASKPNQQDPQNYNSEDKLTKYDQTVTSNKNNLNLSSVSLDKTIIWFCAGAFGYAVIYAIGKSISEK